MKFPHQIPDTADGMCRIIARYAQAIGELIGIISGDIHKPL